MIKEMTKGSRVNTSLCIQSQLNRERRHLARTRYIAPMCSLEWLRKAYERDIRRAEKIIKSLEAIQEAEK